MNIRTVFGDHDASIHGTAFGNRRNPRGFTFAEAMVLIVLIGSCMVPILGTLQSGVQKTDNLYNNARMQLICESKLNEAIARVAYMKSPVETGKWYLPIASIDQGVFVGTYVIEVKLLPESAVGALGYSGTTLPCVIGTQPANIKAVAVSVSVQNNDTSVATETVKLYSLVSLPTSTYPNRVFLSDPVNLNIYSVDPESKNLIEVFKLPLLNVDPTNAANDPNRPGNLAVHPNNKWVAVQRQSSIALLETDTNSPTHGRVVGVYASTTTFLETPANSEKIREDRGVGFRPDGRFCYVTSHSPACLSVFAVPPVLPATFTFVTSYALPNTKIIDFRIGDDGYVYLANKDYANKCFNRAGMFNNQIFEDYSFNWLTFPNKKPLAVTTMPDGRDTLALFEDCYVYRGPSWPPTATVTQYCDISANGVGGEDLRDIEVTHDGLTAVLSSKKGGANTRIYGIKLPFDPATVNTWGAPNGVAYPGNGEKTNLAITSPYGREIFVDRQANPTLFCLNGIDLCNGSYTTAIPTDREISIDVAASGTIDAAHIAARIPEEVVIGCSDNSNHRLYIADLYGKDFNGNPIVYEDKTVILSDAPINVALSPMGDYAAVTPKGAGKTFQGVDMIDKKLISDTVAFSAANVSLIKGTFTLDKGFVAAKEAPTGTAVGTSYPAYSLFASGGALLRTEQFVYPLTVVDLIPLNEGGAFVLASGAAHTELHWVASQGQIFARWSSNYDKFPPKGVTRMAVSADDSLLALYDPQGAGATKDAVYLYDLRSQNFGSLTQRKGLISEIRDNNSGNFNAALPYINHNSSTLTTTNRPLTESLTANDSFTRAQNWPCNFYVSATTDKYILHSTRFFGYFCPPSDVEVLANWTDDAGRFFINGALVGDTAQWLPHSSQAMNSHISMSATGSYLFQSDYYEYCSPGTHGVFTTGNTAGSLTGASVVGDGVESPTGTGPWTKLASESLRPFRFAPQFISDYWSSTAFTGDKIRFVFSRDVASPTLYALDCQNNYLYWLPFGGSTGVKNYSSALGTLNDMAISPDGQRLIITSASPNRAYMVDISIPATSTFGNIIGTVSLSLPPVSLATRRFNRHWSKHNVYESVANLNYNISGTSNAVPATGGIYIMGGASDESQAPIDDAARFNPVSGSIVTLSDKLLGATKKHSVISYDNEILSFLGTDNTSCLPDVQKWNIATDKKLRSQPPSGLIGHWPMDENTGTIAHDTSGNGLDGTLSAGASWSTGKYGSGVLFNGTNGYVEVPHNSLLNLTTSFTVSAWVEATGLPGSGDWDAIISKDVNDRAFSIWHKNESGTPELEIWYGSSSGSNQTEYTNAFTLNTWYHCAVTYNGSIMKIYKNGAEVVSSTVSAPPANGKNLYFGQRGDNAYYFDGAVDDIQIYNRPLSAEEVSIVMSGGIATDDIMTFVTNDAYGRQLRKDQAACQTPYGIALSGGLNNSNVATSAAYTYWPHAVASFTKLSQYTPPSGLLCWWKFDEMSGSAVIDSSGNGYNGALQDSPTCVAGKYGNALSFDGTNDFVRWTPKMVQDDFTFACWFKTSYKGDGIDHWLTKPLLHSECANTLDDFGFGIDSNGKLAFGNGDSSTDRTINGNTLVSDNNWHFGAVTREKSTGNIKLYVDGNLDASGVGGTTSLNDNLDLDIAYGSDGGGYFNGLIDNVMIFNRVLSLTEIQSIYSALPDSGALEKVSPSNMTDFSVPAPYTVEESGHHDSTEMGWRAFDGNDNGSLWEVSGLPGHLILDLGTAKVVTEVRFDTYAEDSGGEDVKGFKIHGSNDKMTWTSLFSGTSPQETVTQWYTYQFVNSTAYRYYKITCESNYGDSEVNIDEMQYWGLRPSTQYGISRELPNMPGSRAGHSLVYINGKLYRIGGSTDGTYANILATVDRFNFETNSWAQLTSAADADEFTDTGNLFKRMKAGVCVCGDEVFVFGGMDTTGGAISSAAAWNPKTGRIRQLANIPQTIDTSSTLGNRWYAPCAVPCGPYIYIIGGALSSSSGGGCAILRYTP